MRKKRPKRRLFARLRRLELRELHRHPFAIPLGVFMLLFVVCLGLFFHFSSRTVQASDAHVVILNSDGKRLTLPTRADNVGDFLDRINLKLNQGDVVEPAKDTAIVQDNFRVNIYRAKPVTIVDGNHTAQAFSAATTPRSIAEQAGITVFPEDTINSQPTTDFLKDGSIGQRVVIDRATLVNLNLYGTPIALRTHAKTVSDLLKEKHVTLANGDTVTPAASTPITTASQVFVTRFGTQIVSQQEDIPMPTQTIEDDSLTFGTTAVRQQGSVGKKVVTYQIELANGQEVSRHEIQEVVSVEPVTQIIAKGRAVDIPSDKEAVMAAAGISSSDYAYVDYVVSHESGWCPTKWQGEHTCPPYYEDLHSIDSGYGYGLGQATPAGKMAPYGADWQTSAITQLHWATSYASRYGGWAGAYNHWAAYHNW